MKLTILFLLLSICSFAQIGASKSSATLTAPTKPDSDSVTVVFPESVQKDLQEIEKNIIELKQGAEKLEASRAKIINALYGGQGIDPNSLTGTPRFLPGILKFKKK